MTSIVILEVILVYNRIENKGKGNSGNACHYADSLLYLTIRLRARDFYAVIGRSPNQLSPHRNRE